MAIKVWDFSYLRNWASGGQPQKLQLLHTVVLKRVTCCIGCLTSRRCLIGFVTTMIRLVRIRLAGFLKRPGDFMSGCRICFAEPVEAAVSSVAAESPTDQLMSQPVDSTDKHPPVPRSVPVKFAV